MISKVRSTVICTMVNNVTSKTGSTVIGTANSMISTMDRMNREKIQMLYMPNLLRTWDNEQWFSMSCTVFVSGKEEGNMIKSSLKASVK